MQELPQGDCPMIRRRQVYHLVGYDPITPKRFYQRFIGQTKIFNNTWGITTSVSRARESSRHCQWTGDAWGAGWHVRSEFDLWRWDDIIGAAAERSQAMRLASASVTYFDLLVTGTIFRYLAANLRYFLFAIVPLLEVALFAVAGGVAGAIVARMLNLDGAVAAAVMGLIGIGGLFLLLQWPGRRWRLAQALDDWNFSRQYIRGRQSEIECRLDHFADALIARAQEGSLDEIVIVGHSLGAVFAVEVAARALARDPEFGRRGVSINILTVGATIPKCALHPAADHIRERIAQVAREPSIHWAEFQSRGDPISFYKFDPVSLRRLDGDRLEQRPIIRRVQIHDMLQPKTFARYRLRPLRLHYQSVMANDRRAPYDYFMAICGPVPFAAWTTSPKGLLDFIDMDGIIKTDRAFEVAQ